MEKSVKERIIDILDNTFKILDNCYKNNGEALGKADYNASGSRIIFPCYSDGERRISEQELRFVFVGQARHRRGDDVSGDPPFRPFRAALKKARGGAMVRRKAS